MTTSTEASEAAPVSAVTVAIPAAPLPESVTRTTPSSSVEPRSPDRVPRVVEKWTTVPGFTGNPVLLRATTVIEDLPFEAIELGLAEIVRIEPVGATGSELSHPKARRLRAHTNARVRMARV